MKNSIGLFLGILGGTFVVMELPLAGVPIGIVAFLVMVS